MMFVTILVDAIYKENNLLKLNIGDDDEYVR
ncbi:hypothetical protein Anamo_1332 [Acetomicrobium mobile DSM 13181]|uniref:Uncharacterized protein n=1 Tax=Acetomicrobium mobile (strain ATCC BAA-54 / DSM 13181 / JCM 12221 / NGA) TaxID=891968 RepID=I4BXD4_ACEMN|nr:hypothetical protein Anamo_1332 [Acetomicrobium mobile DSM 13181]